MKSPDIERFNATAETYDTYRCPGRGASADAALALLEPGPDDVVLDLGCGPGLQLAALAPAIRAGYGVDPAAGMIARAVRSAGSRSNLRFFVGEAEALPDPVRRAGITKVFTNYALHHLPDERKRLVLLDLAALLPAGGRLVYGDLMLSADPADRSDAYDHAGYDPATDRPARLEAVEAMFAEAGLSPVTRVFHPLIAVVAGRKA